jgi:hypothetical protein
MLAGASISQADVSKAKPPAPRPAIGHTHAGRRPHRGANKRRRRGPVARHTGCRSPPLRRKAGAWSPPRRGGPVGAASRRGPPRRGRRWALGTEMSVGEGEGGRRRGRARLRREMALRACRGGAARRVGEERCGASEKRGASGKNAAIWGKRLSALEGDKAYIEPPPFVTIRITNHDKRPFSLGSYYESRLKASLLSRVASRPVTKGTFHAGCPEGEFSPFCHGWCYHPWQKGGPLVSGGNTTRD